MRSFAEKPTIVGDLVTLRPMAASDAEDMWRDTQDPDARRLTGTHDTFTREQIEQWCASRADHDDRLDFAIIENAIESWAGEVVISDWDGDNSSCGFRIALSASAQNRGLGTESTKLIVDYLFDEIGVNRIELEVFAFNPRAITVYQRIGFIREGVRRQALRWSGERIDAIMMSIIASDRSE